MELGKKASMILDNFVMRSLLEMELEDWGQEAGWVNVSNNFLERRTLQLDGGAGWVLIYDLER